MLTTAQAAQVRQIATHAEHATHRDDSRLSTDRSLSKTVQSLFCFLVLVSSFVLVPYGMGGFHLSGYMGFDRVSPTGVTWAFEASSLTTAKRRMCLCPFGFSTFTSPTYAINEDMRMRGYEIWNGDAGEDVYECNGYGHGNGIKENCEYYFWFPTLLLKL